MFDSDGDEISWQLPYIDFTSAFVAVMAALFLMALVEVNPVKATANAERQAQVVVALDWPTDRDCDVDLWVKDPLGKTVFFRHEREGLSALERDDRGDFMDTMTAPDGHMIIVHDNKEFWAVRGIIPGTYYASVHLYTCRVGTPPAPLAHGKPANVHAKVSLEKVNPTFTLLKTREVEMVNIWDEVPVLQFDIDGEGNVLNIDDSTEILVKPYLQELNDTGSMSGPSTIPPYINGNPQSSGHL